MSPGPRTLQKRAPGCRATDHHKPPLIANSGIRTTLPSLPSKTYVSAASSSGSATTPLPHQDDVGIRGYPKSTVTAFREKCAIS